MGRKGFTSFNFSDFFFFCILIDTGDLVLSMTPDKLIDISALVQIWFNKIKCPLKDLQSLFGKLNLSFLAFDRWCIYVSVIDMVA